MYDDGISQQELYALERIVAVLFALADLAEGAAARAPLVRAMALWLLRPAEALARSFILDFCGGGADVIGSSAFPTPHVLETARARREDAIALALSFRALARALALWCSLVDGCRRAPGGVNSERLAALHTFSALAKKQFRSAGVRPVWHRVPDTS